MRTYSFLSLPMLIRFLSGETINADIGEKCTIAELKKTIQVLNHCENNRLSLLYNGVILDDENDIEYYRLISVLFEPCRSHQCLYNHCCQID